MRRCRELLQRTLVTADTGWRRQNGGGRRAGSELSASSACALPGQACLLAPVVVTLCGAQETCAGAQPEQRYHSLLAITPASTRIRSLIVCPAPSARPLTTVSGGGGAGSASADMAEAASSCGGEEGAPPSSIDQLVPRAEFMEDVASYMKGGCRGRAPRLGGRAGSARVNGAALPLLAPPPPVCVSHNPAPHKRARTCHARRSWRGGGVG